MLGLLAIKPWSSYELTRQMDRSLGRIWPRAQSKLYEEPKKLVAHGLARSATERNGRRTRTVYAITTEGRRALRDWLAEPGAGPALEFEQLLKVFFADHGTTADVLATLAAAQGWAQAAARSPAVGEQYADGRGQFPNGPPCSAHRHSSPTSTCWSATGRPGPPARRQLARRSRPGPPRPRRARRDARRLPRPRQLGPRPARSEPGRGRLKAVYFRPAAPLC